MRGEQDCPSARACIKQHLLRGVTPYAYKEAQSDFGCSEKMKKPYNRQPTLQRQPRTFRMQRHLTEIVTGHPHLVNTPRKITPGYPQR